MELDEKTTLCCTVCGKQWEIGEDLECTLRKAEEMVERDLGVDWFHPLQLLQGCIDGDHNLAWYDPDDDGVEIREEQNFDCE